MDDYDELLQRDRAMGRIVAAVSELENEIRLMVTACQYPRIRVDLRSLMLDLADTRNDARRRTSWWATSAGEQPEL